MAEIKEKLGLQVTYTVDEILEGKRAKDDQKVRQLMKKKTLFDNDYKKAPMGEANLLSGLSSNLLAGMFVDSEAVKLKDA